MSTHNASNWPPLQINGTRVRAGYANISDEAIMVTMPALKTANNSFASLLTSLNSQADIEVLFSRAVPRPKGEPASMCGGKFADPEGYIAKLLWMDLKATAGDRIDLDLTFGVLRKLPCCAYSKSDSNVRVFTWEDLYIEVGQESMDGKSCRTGANLGELMLRMSPGLVTGCFAEYLIPYVGMSDDKDFYDIDEFDARITLGDLKLR